MHTAPLYAIFRLFYSLCTHGTEVTFLLPYVHDFFVTFGRFMPLVSVAKKFRENYDLLDGAHLKPRVCFLDEMLDENIM